MRSEIEAHWETTGRTEVYAGRVRLVDHAVVLPDGTRTHYEVDESIPFAVATLVVDDGDVILTRQYRYPLDRWIHDLPGGAGAATESPSAAARRELEEELGLTPHTLKPLHTFAVNPGRSAWSVHLFFCEAWTSVGPADASDPSEEVRLVRMALHELDAAIASGEIVDPSLIVARACAAASGLLPPLGATAQDPHRAGAAPR
ncbi:NUDIX hydrolase [Microbacterium sp. JZ37]|uniref:NUDIX hydrolase n=1 Tax=Microbacterium sp. JZ37 TaxID=2654193 RepID=UPI002B45FAAA|nr:NUDIX hydrolase [Microbacterium sp. JZ37]WRH16747.1 NUDIX domain-containing protein [Microbacterium sp. JZ37]